MYDNIDKIAFNFMLNGPILIWSDLYKNNIFGFLDALAYIALMIKTDWLTDWFTYRLEVDSPADSSDPSDLITQNGMSLKIECHSKLNFTQNEMSLKMGCHKKGMSLKKISLQMDYHLNELLLQNKKKHSNGIAFKMECHSKCIVTQSGMSLNL